MITTIILLGCVLLCLIIIFKKWVSWESSDDPSSPPVVPGSLPLIGHLLYLGGRPEKVLMKWAQKYGKMFMVNLGPLKTLIIDDPVLMRDLLNQPSFSGRIQNEVFTLLSQQGHGLMFAEGETWESQRKFTIKILREFGFRKQHMENLVSNEVKELVLTFKEYVANNKPLFVKDTFILPLLNGLWILIAGEKLQAQDTRLNELLYELIEATNKIQKTGVLFAPILRHISPSLSGWNRFMTANESLNKFIEQKLADHIETYTESHNRDLIDSFISEIKNTSDVNSPFYKETGYKNLHVTIMDIFIAGSETTSSTLNWAILYLTAYPEIQEKLHREIVSVVGTKRSPNLSDRPNLPYTEATLCEILRITSFTPVGLMHRVLQDTEWHGFRIREGTLVLANLYSAHYNREQWNEPERFRPERFLSPNGREKIKNPPHFVPFSVGRRQCLGESFAMDSLFLFIASIFQNFEISPEEKNQKLDLEPSEGLVRVPKPFSVKIQSRC